MMNPQQNKKDGGADAVGGVMSPEEGACGSTEMEMGSGGHHVKLEEAGAAAGEGSEGQVKAGNSEGEKEDETVLELEKLIKDLHVKSDPQGLATKVELLSKLEEARVETADRRRVAERIKWKEEVRMELSAVEEFRSTMASVPLENVTDSGLKADMSKMSMEWREAFKNERTNFLFDKVFPVLYQNAAHKSKCDVVLTSRTVSKVWKSSAESFMLSKFHLGKTYWDETELGIQTHDYVPICVHSFNNEEEMAMFNHWTEAHYLGANPFFSRRLSIGFGGMEWKNNLGFWNGVEIMLRQWGSEIWVVWLKLDKGMTFEVMYEQLVKLLKLMPNLRCLFIFDRPNSMLVTDMMRDLGKDIYGPLKVRILRNPLPELPHLRHLQFQDTVVTVLAQAALAKYKGSVEYVAMHENEPGEGEDPRKLLTHGDLILPQLKFLGLSGVASPRVFAYDVSGNCPRLENFFLMQPNLKVGSDLLVLFQNVSRLRSIPTLKRVSLSVHPPASVIGMPPRTHIPLIKLTEEQLKSLVLDLPQLESFLLNVVQINLKNIDFLLPCVGLKDLRLDYEKRKTIKVKTKEEIMAWAVNFTGEDMKTKKKEEADAEPPRDAPVQDEIIQFFHYTNRLYESNLWKLFPELKRVTIKVMTSVLNCHVDEYGYTTSSESLKCKTKVYTRAGYEKYLAGK